MTPTEQQIRYFYKVQKGKEASDDQFFKFVRTHGKAAVVIGEPLIEMEQIFENFRQDERWSIHFHQFFNDLLMDIKDKGVVTMSQHYCHLINILSVWLYTWRDYERKHSALHAHLKPDYKESIDLQFRRRFETREEFQERVERVKRRKIDHDCK